MKKIIVCLYYTMVLFISACSNDKAKENNANNEINNKTIEVNKINQDIFKVSIQDKTEENFLTKQYETTRYLILTAKDDIEITKITANRGACEVQDRNYGSYIGNNVISGNIPAKICYKNVLDVYPDFVFGSYPGDCKALIKWLELSGDCKYFYNTWFDVLEKGNQNYIKSCKKAKEQAQGNYYYDYKLPMKFGKTAKFSISKCSEVLEITIFTNKGDFTYTF